MGTARRPGKVKLVAGILYNDTEAYGRARRSLERAFGRVDYESPPMEFGHTDYYTAEMGRGLKRKFLSFGRLIRPEDAYRAKIAANRIEGKISVRGRRRVNIDPGCMDLAKFVLFSTKDYSHRIYLQKGIYAEVTLCYRDKKFCPLPWTYPDYRTEDYAVILNSIREIYKKQKLS